MSSSYFCSSDIRHGSEESKENECVHGTAFLCSVFWLILHVETCTHTHSQSHSKRVDLNANFKNRFHCIPLYFVRMNHGNEMHFLYVLHLIVFFTSYSFAVETWYDWRVSKCAALLFNLSINRTDVRLAFQRSLDRQWACFVYIYRFDCHWSNLST